MVKNLPDNSVDSWDAGLSPGRENPPEEEMATHSGNLAGIIQRTEEPCGLQYLRLQESDTTKQLNSKGLNRLLLSKKKKVKQQVFMKKMIYVYDLNFFS